MKSSHSQPPWAIGGSLFLPKAPRSSATGMGLKELALTVVVALLGAASSVEVEESAAPEKAVVPPPTSPPVAGVGAEVLELCSASPPPPSSGVWGRLPHEGAITTLEPLGLGPLCLAASRGGRPLRLVVPPGRGGTHILLVPVLRHRHLLLSPPGGGRTSMAGPPGTLVSALLAVRRGAGDPDSTVGVTSYQPDARPPSSRVGIDAKTDDCNAWSSHRALTPFGRTSVSRLNVSPINAWIAASSSALVKSVPGPRVILQ
jgi:hypothetical protein